MDDWYHVTVEDIVKNGGGGLLTCYNNSPSSALQSIYPEHNWELERRERRILWKQSQKKFLDGLINGSA